LGQLKKAPALVKEPRPYTNLYFYYTPEFHPDFEYACFKGITFIFRPFFSLRNMSYPNGK